MATSYTSAIDLVRVREEGRNIAPGKTWVPEEFHLKPTLQICYTHLASLL